jgi:hypothetical protein
MGIFNYSEMRLAMGLKKVWADGTDEVYSTVLEDNGSYEADGKHSTTYADNRFEALNQFYGVLNARNYSASLQWQGWTIREIEKLNQTRFNFGEGDIVGRDIIIQYSKVFDLSIIRDMVHRADYSPIEFSFEDLSGDNRTVKVWLPGSGKRTRYGKESTGEVVERIKVHYTSKHKRNRKTMGF